MTGKRIRSTHQRRILDWLADGGGTVTEVSKALTMRLPHASAALKKLRESGDVVRDHVTVRGSKHRLSSQGLARLESDGFNRLSELVKWPPPAGAVGIVLARESSMLLLGYASNPRGPLLGLPDRPIDATIGDEENSNGNIGASTNWRWAVARDENPVWCNLDTKARAETPDVNSPISISSWVERPKVMGVIRARLLDDKTWPLGVGSWFSSLPAGLWPDLPQSLRDGDASIGRASNSGPKVKPRGGVQAKVGRRHDQALLIRSMYDGALCMADASLLGVNMEPLPFGILRHWLSELHPRLNAKSILEKSKRLQSDLQSSVSNAATRKLLSDFPGKKWSEQNSGILDTKGLSQRAAKSVLQYAIEERDEPLVIHWRWPVTKGELDRLASDSRCRLVICEGVSLPLPFTLISATNIGKFILETPERIRLPISLEARMEMSIPSNWKEPSNPNEIEWRSSDLSPNFAKNERDAMWISCSLKDGNSAWADKHENDYPLAAWIATPNEERVSRWRRIGENLPAEWILLAELDTLELEMLCEISLHIDDAFSKVIEKIRRDPLTLIEYDSLIDHPAMASAVLCSLDWFETPPDFDRICIAFLKNPLQVGKVLRLCWQNSFLPTIISACPYHSALLNNSSLERDEIIGIMEGVHYSLWNERGLEWLRMLLSSVMGRSILTNLELPWPVILSELPISSENLHLVHHLDDGPGKDSLLDVFEALVAREEQVIPPYGRTHPLSGWLFQPTIPLPPTEIVGNIEIHLELHRRFHH